MPIVQVQVNEIYQDVTTEVIGLNIDNVQVTRPKPVSFTDTLRGLHRSIWQDVNTEDWLRLERDAWETTS